MKREEILAMEPGRELDALVGEKISGWWEPIDGLSHLPRYSTDISAAWEVVEEMSHREHNGAFIGIMPAADFYMVEAHGKADYHVSHPNVCLAICRVALLAVMEA